MCIKGDLNMHIKEVLKTVKENTERDACWMSLCGSRNYNLHQEDSDYDFIGFVKPTLEDLYHGKQFFKEIKGINTDDGNEYTIRLHDIRKFPELLWKSNPSYLEMLFSGNLFDKDNSTIHVDRILFPLYQFRDQIARMNLPYMYNASMGIFYNKLKYLDNGTTSSKRLVEKYGYDTKQAMHAYRILYILEVFALGDFNDYIKCIKHYKNKDEFLRIKNGEYSRKDIEKLLNGYFNRIETNFKPIYMNQEPNKELYDDISYSIESNILDEMRGRLKWNW